MLGVGSVRYVSKYNFIGYIVLTILLMLSTSNSSAVTNLKQFIQPSLSQSLPQNIFQVSAQIESKTVRVAFSIANGSYIYKDKLSFSNDYGPVVDINKLYLPLGLIIKAPDESGIMVPKEVLDGNFIVDIPLSLLLNKTTKPIALRVVLQGCSSGKMLCYPPQVYLFNLNQIGIKTSMVETSATYLLNNVTIKNAMKMLTSSNAFNIFIMFFIAGIAMSLTPCTYPLYPIALSAINGVTTRRKNIIQLSLCYVHGISFIYVILGIIAAFSNILITTYLQRPLFVLSSSAILLLLGLAMFDLLEVKMPNALHNYLSVRLSSLVGGRYTTAFLMGIFSSLLLGPCVTPPFILAIGFIAKNGSILVGILSLYALSLGMSMPILILATVGNKLLPKSGLWMHIIKHLLGFLLIIVAIYLAYPFIDCGNDLINIGILSLITVFIFLLVKHFHSPDLQLLIHKLLPLLLLGVGTTCIIVGLKQLTNKTDHLIAKTNAVTTTSSVEYLDYLFAHNNLPIIVIVSANWCSSCRSMEANTFRDKMVLKSFSRYLVIKLDITANQLQHANFLKKYNLYGVPAILIFNAQHKLVYKLSGYISSQELLKYTLQAERKFYYS